MTQRQVTGFKIVFSNVLFFFLTLLVGLGFAELLLRLKNSDQKNYNIEMWRYAKLLKVRSADPDLGHEHRPGTHATLEGVEVRINSLGMRGPEPDLADTSKKRILFLGSSNTLGWGVAEKDTLCGILRGKLAESAQIFNAGIGNYNAHRYVSLYEKRLQAVHPDMVVIHYFIRDAENLQPGGGNWLLRNSELAVMLHTMIYEMGYGSKNASGLVDHYKKMYSDGSPGLESMRTAMRRLDELSKEQHFKIIIAMVPDIHAVQPYPFTFIHERVRELAASYGWTFVDLSEALSRVPQKELWVMLGDPHINAKGQSLMAETLLPYLS